MRAFTYSRQSLDLAEGIDRQLERTRRLAEQRGYTIVREWVDNDTSATKSRANAEWPKMLAALQAGEADVVIAVDLDRLVRSLRDMLLLMDTGAAVLTVDGEIDLTTADGEFRASMMASLARFETKRKSERQLRANDYRVSVGRPNPQRRRYGYDSDMRTPRPTEAAVVVRVFEAVAARKSLRSIATALNADGITTATGKAWEPGRLREMVQRPYDTGFTYRGETVASAEVVPIVSAELAGIARAVLADPTRKTTPGPTVRHMVSGLVFCGVCDHAMVYMQTYRCKADSSHPSIVKSVLEPIVVREVARAVVTYTGEVRDGGRTDIRALVAEHARTEERVAAIVRDRDDGLVSAAVARARLVELRDEREAIEAKLEAARSSSSALVTLHGLAKRLQGGQISAVSAKFLELELGEQRELIKQLLLVTVNRGRGAERVDVEHLEAVWLNAGSEVSVDD